VGNISFLNKEAGYRRFLAQFLVLVIVLSFIPIAPAYATAPTLTVTASETTVTVSQDVTIIVESNQELNGPPFVMVVAPDESTMSVETTETDPNVWTGFYHVDDMSALEGEYLIYASGMNLLMEEGTATVSFVVDFSGGGPGSGDSTIKGMVFGTTGEPPALSGCDVALFNQEFYGEIIAEAQTGGELTEYQFTNLPEGTYWVQAEPPAGMTDAAASERVEVAVGPSQTVTQNLSLRVPSLTGLVVDPNGNPVADVFVQARTEDWSVFVEADTDSQGRFALPPVGQNTYIIVAFAPPESEFANSAPRSFSLGSGTVDITNDPLMLRNTIITGRVMNPEGTGTVSGANVMIHNQNWTFQEEAMTDANGYYRFGQIPAGEYIIEVFPGFDTPGSYSQSSPLTVSVTGSPQTITDIHLTYPSIVGTVTVPGGAPASWAFVQVHNNDWTIFAGSPADENGNYAIGGLPNGTYTIEAMPSPDSPFSKSASQNVTVDGTKKTINLQLTTPLIVGWAYDGQDQSVRDAFVNLHNGDWSISHFVPPTGSDGRFSFGGVTPGTYHLEVNPPWDKPNLMRPEPLTITVIDETSYTVEGSGYEWVTVGGTTGLKITFPQASKTINGTVTKQGGGAVSNAQVFAFQEKGAGFAWTATDSNGQYSLGVSGGKWMVAVGPSHESASAIDWAYTGLPKPVSFAKDSSPETKVVDFQVVTATAQVTGQVVAPDGETPVQHAHVEVRNSTGQGNGGGPDMGGNFTVNVPPGTYQVMVFLPPDSPFGSPPAQTVTVSDTQTVDVGTLQLTQKNSQIKGVVTGPSGKGVSSAQVVAWNQKGGFAEATTGSDGTYTLNVSAGSWEVMVVPTDNSSYVYSGPPKRITVEDNQIKTGVSFPVVFADATIQGRVVGDTETVSSLYGFAVAMDEYSGYGGPLEAGRFEIKVPSGTYNVSGGLPPGSPFMLNAANNVVVGIGETKKVELSLVANDKKITGMIRNQAGQPITDENLFLEVFAVNNTGSFQHTVAEKDQVTGEWSYELNVSAGQWQIGYFVDPSTGYISKPPMGEGSSVTLSSGDTSTAYHIDLYSASAQISGRVTLPNGSGVPYAFVGAEQVKSDSVRGRDAFFVDTMTDADGYYTLNVPAGTYEVHAGLPPKKMRTSNLIHPAPVEVTLSEEGTTTVNLQFGQATASISGSAKIGSNGVPALIWAWTETGGYAEIDANADGSFTLPVKGGNTWHIGAAYESDNGFFEAAEQAVTVPASGTVTASLSLSAVTQSMPGAVSVTFPANQMKIIDLANGTKIQVPAGALGVNGNVTVTAKPTAGLRKQKDSVPIGFGYELTALDANGRVIKSFNSAVTVTFPYDPNSLPSGVTENDLVPAYWDEESGTWQKVGSAVVDTVNHTITVKVGHFSLWGNIIKATVADTGSGDSGGGGGGGATDAEAPAAPTGLTATAGKGQVGLSWSANSESDLNGYYVYRATVNNADQATKIATVAKDKTSYTDLTVAAGIMYHYWLAAYDASGNESAKAGPVSATPEKRVNPFSDIAESNWAYNYILDLVDKEIISGYKDGSFRPAATVTRAEFSKMVCLAMGWDLVEPATPSFTDVAKNNWAYKYIETVKAHGIIGGYSDGTFRPSNNITRAEIAKIVAGSLGISSGSSELTDVGSHWAKDFIDACAEAGIVGGYTDGTFRPNNTATRAEAAKMIVGVLNY